MEYMMTVNEWIDLIIAVLFYGAIAGSVCIYDLFPSPEKNKNKE